MWAYIGAYIYYGEDEMSSEEREAFYDADTSYADRSLGKKIDEKMTPILDKFINLDLNYDTDLYGDEDDPGWFSLYFDDSVSKEQANEVIELVKEKLSGTYGDTYYEEYYGNQISGGYPSYDPPEYESFELSYCAELVFTDKIEFE